MTILRFQNSRLPKDSRDYTVEIPAHQNVDAAVQSLEDSGWTLAEREDENTADSKSAGTKTRKAQSAPSTHEGN